ncbi:hypothetical protein F4779DRAFT_624806 [Xylariaceae sp. FL0662B]|nr:hypothetical protein F4779DRAFT_624806 [Xylariaceae sp. FL0662B]
MDPQNDISTTGNCGVAIDVYPPSPPANLNSDFTAYKHSPSYKPPAISPSLRSIRSAKSVESLTVTGAIPLDSLRVHEPDEDQDPATPLTIPDLITMEPSDSRPSFPKGSDVLLLDDLPANFTIGCDTMSFSTTQPFQGFRNIPSGGHLFWVAPSESTSSRSAYWIITPEREDQELGEVYVKQWDKFNEVLSDPASHAEERFQKEKLEQIFDDLMPYQYRSAPSGVASPVQTREAEPLPSFLSDATIWFQLTFAIHAGLLNRLTGKTQRSWPVTTFDRVAGEASIAQEAQLYADETRLRFMFPMDAQLINPAAAGEERTRQALDPTAWVLDKTEGSAGDEDSRPDDLVGEIQFAFLTGMHLGNFSCLEQWWFLVDRVVFRCYGLATARPRLARNLIQTVHAQLVYNDRRLAGDVFETAPDSARRLRRTLTTYKARLDEALLGLADRITPDQHAVGTAFASLEAFLWRLGWDLRGDYVRAGGVMLEDGEVVQAELSDFEDEDERGEFAPVVVELGDNGREAGLVSWDG